MKFDVRGDVSQIIEHLSEISRRHVPYATTLAINRSLEFGQKKLQEEIPRAFSAPTKWTLNASRIKKATKYDRTGEIKIKDEAFKGRPAIEWLEAEIYGGARSKKRSEQLLDRAGRMPPGHYLVPTRFAPLDANGNVSRGLMQKVLADCQAHWDVAQRTTAASRDKRMRKRKAQSVDFYFSTYPVNSRTRHLKPGIYKRMHMGHGVAIRPIFLFASKVRYRKRLDFFKVVDDAARARFPMEFALAMRHALATAK